MSEGSPHSACHEAYYLHSTCVCKLQSWCLDRAHLCVLLLLPSHRGPACLTLTKPDVCESTSLERRDGGSCLYASVPLHLFQGDRWQEIDQCLLATKKGWGSHRVTYPGQCYWLPGILWPCCGSLEPCLFYVFVRVFLHLCLLWVDACWVFAAPSGCRSPSSGHHTDMQQWDQNRTTSHYCWKWWNTPSGQMRDKK